MCMCFPHRSSSFVIVKPTKQKAGKFGKIGCGIQIHTLKSLIEEQTGINEQVWEKKITQPSFLLCKLINEQGGIFGLLHEKLQTGWKENLKNLSEHALLLGTSE